MKKNLINFCETLYLGFFWPEEYKFVFRIEKNEISKNSYGTLHLEVSRYTG